LYDVSGSEEVLVSISTLQKWPTHVIKNLYEAAKTLSGLDEESKKRLEDEGKNS